MVGFDVTRRGVGAESDRRVQRVSEKKSTNEINFVSDYHQFITPGCGPVACHNKSITDSGSITTMVSRQLARKLRLTFDV